MNRYGNWQKYQNANPLQRALISRFLQTVVSLLDGLPIRTVLDAGCGEGFVLNALLQKRPDLVGVGLDLDGTALVRGARLFDGPLFVRGDVTCLPCSPASFDCVVCTEVLEHLPDPRLALKELCRVSREYCLLSVPHEPFFRLSNLLRGKSLSRLGNDIDHLHNWSVRSFTAFVVPHLDVLTVRRPFPWLVLLGRVRR